MPYIIREKRDVLDSAIDNLINALRELECDDPNNSMAGNINYAISTVLSRVYTRRYDEINEAVGVLECAKLEFYRKVAAPYENQKEWENGRVFDVDDTDS